MNRERRQKFLDAQAAAWELFRDRLENANTFIQAEALAKDMPGRDRPGRSFHVNLLFLLDNMKLPASASHEEAMLYAGLLRRLDAGKSLQARVTERAIEEMEGKFGKL